MSALHAIHQSKKARIVTGVILLFAVFVAPWWVVVILGATGTFLFNGYGESIAAAFVFDLLYSIPRTYFLEFTFVVTVIMLVLFLLISFFKQYIRY